MKDESGRPLSLGSGFIVRNGEIASNLHVVQGAVRGYAKLIGQKTKYDIEGVTAFDSKRDLVVLKISTAASRVLTIGNSNAAQVGESVYAVGNPQGLEGTFSQGIISSIREVGTDKLIQITAPISPGSSGGPVLNDKGEVIGVSVATYRGGQNLNFAIPSSYLSALLTSVGPVKPLAQLRAIKAPKSITTDMGGRSTEGVVGGQLTWHHPDNPYPNMGDYDFSIRNKLRESVRNVYCLVVFYDRTGNPVDVDVVRYQGTIPAGLAKRVSGEVATSVKELVRRGGKIELRILDFQLQER
jgi:hypothetical protein